MSAVRAISHRATPLDEAARRRAATVFSTERGLAAAPLGSLGGAYDLGFAPMHQPPGRALDRRGAWRAAVALPAVALGGCAA